MIEEHSKPELKRNLSCQALCSGDLMLTCTVHEPVFLHQPSVLQRQLLLLLDGESDVIRIVERLNESGIECSSQEVLEELNRLDDQFLLEDRTTATLSSKDDPVGVNRYDRQMRYLAGWRRRGTPFSVEAQRRLADSHLAIFGLGGFGSHLVYQAVAMGVGRVTGVDADEVALTDLSRQCLYREEDIGRPKADGAVESCRKLNSSVHGRFVRKRIASASDFVDLLEAVDLAFLAADMPRHRIFDWMNEASYRRGVPVLYSLGILQTRMFIGPLVVPGRTACFRCAMPELDLNPDDPVARFINGRQRQGVLVSPIMIATGIMMFEATKHLTGFDSCGLYDRRLILDLRTYETSVQTIARRGACPDCGSA